MCVSLVDKAGRVLVAQGAPPGLDVETFATLVAADFAANEQLAALAGETSFHTLVHRGGKVALDVEDVRGRVLVVTLFDVVTAPGLVRRAATSLAAELDSILDGMLEGSRREHHSAHVLAGAEDEIDRMFDW